MASTLESAFVLIDRASPAIRSIRLELRELQADAQKAGRDLDNLSGPKVAKQMEKQAQEMRSARDETQALGQEADKSSQGMSRMEQRSKGLESQTKKTRLEFGALGKVMGLLKWPALIAGAGGLVQVLGALAGGAVALLPKLLQLGGAGAAYGAVMVGAGEAMGVVKLATQGLSQAMAGNKKAFASLTPDAKTFVAQLRSMKPELTQLRESAQRGLFGGVDSLLSSIRKQAPAINAIVARTSSSLGGLARFAGGQISGAGFMGNLSTVAGEGNTAFAAAGKSAVYLGEALMQVMVAARPLVDWMSRMAVRESELVLQHAKLGRESGRLAAYFDRTRQSIKLFADIGMNVFEGLRGVMHAATGESNSLWTSIDRMAKRFDKWSNSVSGQNRMTSYFRQMRPVLSQTVGLFGDIAKAIGRLASGQQGAQMIKALRGAVPALATGVKTLTGSLGPNVIKALTSVVRLFGDLAGQTGPLTLVARAVVLLANGADKLVRALGPLGKVLGTTVGAFLLMKRMNVFGVLGSLRGRVAGAAGGAAEGGGVLGALKGAVTGRGVGGAEGIVGYTGSPVRAGYIANPIAVLLVDKGGSPLSGLGGSGGKAGKVARGAENVERDVTGTAGTAATVGSDAEKAAAAGGLLARASGLAAKLGAVGSRALGGAGIAGTGLMLSQAAGPVLAPVIGKTPASAVGKVAAGASIGAGVASVVPGVGTLAGALGGAGVGGLMALSQLANSMIHLPKSDPVTDPAVVTNLAQRSPGKPAYGDLVPGGPRPSTAALPAAASLAALDKQLAAVRDNLSKLSPRQLAQVQSEARSLARDPSLKKYAGQLNNVADTAQQVRSQVVKNFDQMGQQAANKTAAMAKNVGGSSKQAASIVSQNMSAFSGSVTTAMANGALTTGQGMNVLITNLDRALKKVGQKGLSQIQVATLSGSVNNAKTLAQGKTPAGGFRAGGGLVQVGRRGERGRDEIPMSVGGTDIVVGRGEQIAVFNHPQQRLLDRRLADLGGLDGMFRTVNQSHTLAGVPERFAKGGRVGQSLVTASDYSGGRTASGAIADSTVGFAELSHDYQAGVGADFSALGHLPMGTRISVTYPARGGKTINIPKIDVGAGGPALPPAKIRAVDLTMPAAHELGFSGLGNVLVSVGGVGPGAGGGGGGGGGVWTPISAPNIKGVGAIGNIARGALNKATAAANAYGQAHMPAPVTGGGGGAGPTFTPLKGPLPAKVQWALQAAEHIADRHPPYGHDGAGWGLPAYDCSSYVSTVMDAAGIWPKWTYYTAADPINQHTVPGPGKYITIGTWGTSGQNAHALDVDTPLLTVDGWKTMGTVEVGDEVYAEDGTPTRVTHVSQVFDDKPCFEVEFSDGATLVASEDHRWKVWDTGIHRPAGWRVLSTGQLAQNYTRTTASGWTANRYRVACDAVPQTPEADLPIDPYILGYWLGDGNSHKPSITVGAEDHDHVIGELAKAGYRVSSDVVVETAWGSGHQVYFTNDASRGQTIQGRLKTLGVFGSGRKRIPEMYLHAAPGQRRALLAGLLDSDGCATKQPAVQFSSRSQALAHDVWLLARSVGVKASLWLTQGGHWFVSWTPIANPFRMVRKADKLDRIRVEKPIERCGRGHRDQGKMSIVVIRSVPSVATRCIAVEHPERVFLAGRAFTPTHNTMMSIDGKYFESGGQDGGPHRDSGWSQRFDQYRHPAGFATGGRVAERGRVGEPLHRQGNPGIGRLGYQPSQAEADRIQHDRQRHSARPAMMSAGGRLPDWGGWNARGADVVVRRPTVFGAGERGVERVRITPQGSGAGTHVQIARGAVQINGAGGDPRATQRYVDRRLRQFAEEVAKEIESGAEQDARQVLA